MSELKNYLAKDLAAKIQAESTPQCVWVFDCDGTLITGDIASHTAWWLIRSGLAHPEHLPADWKILKNSTFDYETFHILRKIIIEKRGLSGVYEWEVLLHSGLPESTVRQMVSAVILEGVKQGSLVFTDPVSKMAEAMHQQSWIVSGSPHVCVSGIGARLGIPDERVLGTLLDQVDGIYAGRILPPGIVWEGLKKQVLEEQGIHNPWFVAGDSIGDWYMFEMSTRWCWCVVWDEFRHRGSEFRQIIQTRVLGDKATLPKEPGTYVFVEGEKHWVFEVKRP